jgi:hypothetical protein
LHATSVTLVEPPGLTRPPAEETRSRKSRIYLKLQAPLAEPIIGFIDDLAALPRLTTFDDLLAHDASQWHNSMTFEHSVGLNFYQSKES